MSDCPYFKIHNQEVRSHAIGSQPSIRTIKTPWCSHERSPATMQKAISIIGGDKLLSCNGLIANCPIK